MAMLFGGRPIGGPAEPLDGQLEAAECESAEQCFGGRRCTRARIEPRGRTTAGNTAHRTVSGCEPSIAAKCRGMRSARGIAPTSERLKATGSSLQFDRVLARPLFPETTSSDSDRHL